MLRHIVILTALSLSTYAQGADITETAPEILPVQRASSSAFDVLQPLLNAKMLFNEGQFEDSYKNYAAVFLHDPENIDILFGLAESALASDRAKIAHKAYIKLRKLDLNGEQTITQFSGLVLSEIAANVSENPEMRLKQALKTSPDNHTLWNVLGQTYDQKKRWEESRDAYQKAHHFGASEAGFHNNLGMSLLAQKKYKGAVSHFKHAKDLEPSKMQFNNNYRFALLMAGDYQAALSDIDDSQAGTLLADAGFVAIQRKEYTLARILLEKSIEVSPRYNQRAAHNLATLEARQN